MVVGYGDIYSPTSAIVYLTSLEPDDARVRAVAAQVDEVRTQGLSNPGLALP